MIQKIKKGWGVKISLLWGVASLSLFMPRMTWLKKITRRTAA